MATIRLTKTNKSQVLNFAQGQLTKGSQVLIDEHITQTLLTEIHAHEYKAVLHLLNDTFRLQDYDITSKRYVGVTIEDLDESGELFTIIERRIRADNIILPIRVAKLVIRAYDGDDPIYKKHRIWIDHLKITLANETKQLATLEKLLNSYKTLNKAVEAWPQLTELLRTDVLANLNRPTKPKVSEVIAISEKPTADDLANLTASVLTQKLMG